MARRSPKALRPRCRETRKSSRPTWVGPRQPEPFGTPGSRPRYMAALEVENIHTYYGNIHALNGVSLSVYDGEIVTLIGANGAGKTTTLKTISGIVPPRAGSVRLDGEQIQALEPHKIVRLGVCQAPEGRRIFRRM